jgi:hypothetical protein
MATTNVKVRTGNRVIATIDGKQVGLLQNIRLSDDYGLEPASGIGDIHAQEHVPTVARHTVSASALVLIKGAMRELGLAAINGDDALKGIVFDIVVQSKDDGAVLRKYVGCSYGSGDIDIQKHAILVSNATFLALDVVGTGL